ncbi:MAG: hypothetical protein ISS93_00240 [Candidatus Aenigmarchaeota archaeon]|nr:hypothetical protein [Candidatus Aenigmarchaeota archaeon]
MKTFARNKKGQAAMEYLMTYGWAILIVIIVAAVLFSLGIFNPSTYTTTIATGFNPHSVPAGGFKISSGGVITMQLTNGAGATISITAGGAGVGGSHVNAITSPATPITVAPGQTMQLVYTTGASTLTSGSGYSANANITYTNVDSGLTGFISSGTLSGTVS